MKSSAKELFVLILSIVFILALIGGGIYFFVRERNREKSADAIISRAISLATVDINNPATIAPVLELAKNTLVTETAKLEDLRTQMNASGQDVTANISIPTANNDTNKTNATDSNSTNISNTNNTNTGNNTNLNSSNSLNANSANNQTNPSGTAIPSQNALTPAQIQAQLQAQIQAQQELVNNIQAEIAYLQQLLNDAILANATSTPTPTTSQTNGAVPTDTGNPVPTATPTQTATNSVSSTPNTEPEDTFWDQFPSTIYIPKPSVVDTSGKPQLIEGMNPL